MGEQLGMGHHAYRTWQGLEMSESSFLLGSPLAYRLIEEEENGLSSDLNRRQDSEGDEPLLFNIVTVDESCLHSFDPETK